MTDHMNLPVAGATSGVSHPPSVSVGDLVPESRRSRLGQENIRMVCASVSAYCTPAAPRT